ncbi:PKD domain-containing protein [Motilibacter deserti]|uniref:PKD domain-containing protein n=1 Tax=Motilibacter deserti TaxID=2714956 RepID=A0ABX0GVF4_9ACTN|nr:PKD domain-containing protein [Motilibacter deserti]NHC14908.1 hypothetical protein [Motilibacter deserti]
MGTVMARSMSRAAALVSASVAAAALGVTSATPAHAAPAVSGVTLSVKSGVMFGGALATISSFSGPRDGVTAYVSWGDVSDITPGFVAGPLNQPAVFATHRYTTPGTYTVSVVVFDDSGVEVATSTVKVS